MQRLEEAWAMLVFSEDAVPLPRNHRQRTAPREQLKQCIASSVAAEWYVAEQTDHQLCILHVKSRITLAVLLSTLMVLSVHVVH